MFVNCGQSWDSQFPAFSSNALRIITAGSTGKRLRNSAMTRSARAGNPHDTRGRGTLLCLLAE